MKNIYVKLNNINDITEFVRQASLVDGDILVKKGKFCVDGKSLMGVISVDVSTGATVEYQEDARNFEKYLTTFEA